MSGASTNIMISGVRKKLTKKNENTFNFVTGSAWTPMSVSMRKLYCISPRISDQSSAIRSYSLHSDNNWTAWRFKFISFSKRSNVTGQHDRLDERLTGQFPNQSGHCLFAPVALQRGLTSPMALVFFLGERKPRQSTAVSTEKAIRVRERSNSTHITCQCVDWNPGHISRKWVL